MTRILSLVLLLSLSLTACRSSLDLRPSSPYPLASLTESKVTVDIALVWNEDGQIWLEATFTPEEGFHLYSKDIPRGGVDGLGRPTLLELLPGSKMTTTGTLSESIPAIADTEIEGLLLYPVGMVVLRLPILLPEGEGWFDEQVSVTYMACYESTCFPPVVGKIIPVRVAGIKEIIEP